MTARILLTEPQGSPRQTLEQYRARGGYAALERARSEIEPSALIDLVEAAGLRGRGGAAFPTARKWRLAAAASADQKFVVANGGEHEPGSEKDKFLVANYPHAVLEGILLCGHATGASKGYLYLIEDMAPQIEAAEAALAELRDAGLLIFDIEIHRAPTTYVAGEETAAIDSIEGGPGKPKEKPPYPGESGVHGKPTTVNNVESLAHVPFIVREGADAYRAIGTAESPGTMLFTLGRAAKNPGVYELPFGTTYRELIEGCGGGTASGRAIRAVLPALSCGFLAAEHLDVPIAHETLRPLGSSPGCGGVSWIEEGDDVLARLSEIAQFFMDEQCGQCPPCRMETNQLVHVLKGVQAAKGPGYREQITKITDFARGKGRCSLIEMAAASIVSALDVFADDFAAAAGGA
ncbi:MAG: SLBB domain-containing protein [Planctomycetes bacterium]|nr:SLBB domain-containing protein [Planctomycetota bacterium]